MYFFYLFFDSKWTYNVNVLWYFMLKYKVIVDSLNDASRNEHSPNICALRLTYRNWFTIADSVKRNGNGSNIDHGYISDFYFHLVIISSDNFLHQFIYPQSPSKTLMDISPGKQIKLLTITITFFFQLYLSRRQISESCVIWKSMRAARFEISKISLAPGPGDLCSRNLRL